MIYLDYNATTPLDPRVTQSMRPFFEPGLKNKRFGNPSSSHEFGTPAQEALGKARNRVADLLGAQPDQIIFTSGGSESNNTVLQGVSEDSVEQSNHIITSRIEHSAVLEPCSILENKGYEVTYLPVDEEARIDPSRVREALGPDTSLISIMHSNNEVGTIQPIREIAQLAEEYGALVHTDASQSAGKVPIDVEKLGVDFLTIAGHKLYAPKGIGALYIREPDTIEPLIHGANQEYGLRAGTENVSMAVGLGKACEVAKPEQEALELRESRDKLWNILKDALKEELILNGHSQKRLPNTLNVSFVGWEAQTILDQATKVAASMGAACHSGNVELSPVLEAMGVKPEYGKGAIRLSTGRFTEIKQVKEAANELIQIAEQVA